MAAQLRGGQRERKKRGHAWREGGGEDALFNGSRGHLYARWLSAWSGVDGDCMTNANGEGKETWARWIYG